MERLIVASTFLLYPLAATLFSTVAGSGDTLTLNQTLADDGGALVSAGGSFALGFFSPTGSTNRYIGIWYNKISVRTVVWVANRGQPVMDRQGKLSILANGTLVITDSSPTVVRLSSSSVAVSNPVAQLLDDGNFVVREAGSTEASDPNSFAWQSFDFPTDTVLPGMKLGWNLTSQMNRNFTAWFSDNDPSPGNYVSGIDMHGEPQLFLWSGRQQYWRGGPWNGVRFSGIPEMKSDIMYFKFVMDPEEVFWSYYLRDPSTITRLITKNSGLLQHLVWIEGSKSWNVFGVAPKDECDSKISPCGPNGVCYHTGEPMCTCLPGFRPKNSRNWNLSDWNDGCVRKTALDCRTDEFSKQASLKLPDTSRSTVDWSMSLEKCKALCSANCSCTAYASANISGSGSGCIMWTTELTDVRLFDNNLGQDIYVRLAASDIGTEPDISHHSPVVLIIILVSVVTIFLVAGCACWVWYTKRKRTSLDEDEVKDMDLPLYDLATIIDATGNFSTDNKLGQGGFGPVYKGKLADETEVAVKRLSKTSAQGVDEFKNEALLIAKLQHRNLVRLLGCCIQGGERMLMYEYMPNGSLDTFLFDKTKSVLLDWPTRYNIIVSISRGLLYLHQDSRFRIIHRDLKAGNILLDKDMNPKISDFGMARIFGGEDSEVNTRRVVGTYGYMSPEYAMDGVFSVKSDVFSLGVLILEIITGKKNRGVYHSAFHINLLGHVWSLWKEGKVLELVDKSLGHSFPVPEILTCIKVALLCVQERPIDRPTMSAVVKMLGNDNTLLPEPKQSGFVASKDSLAEIDLSTRTKQLSINNMSITLQEGR